MELLADELDEEGALLGAVDFVSGEAAQPTIDILDGVVGTRALCLQGSSARDDQEFCRVSGFRVYDSNKLRAGLKTASYSMVSTSD